MPNIFFVRDLDNSPCVSERKGQCLGDHPYLDPARMVIVRREIESWYIAGIDNRAAKRIKVSPLHFPVDTDNYSKEDFNRAMPRQYDSRIDFMVEILKTYALDLALKRNRSLEYFSKKHLGFPSDNQAAKSPLPEGCPDKDS